MNEARYPAAHAHTLNQAQVQVQAQSAAPASIGARPLDPLRI